MKESFDLLLIIFELDIDNFLEFSPESNNMNEVFPFSPIHLTSVTSMLSIITSLYKNDKIAFVFAFIL